MIKRLFELRKIYSLLERKDRNKNSILTRMMFVESIFIITWQGKKNFLQNTNNKKINMKKRLKSFCRLSKMIQL